MSNINKKAEIVQGWKNLSEKYHNVDAKNKQKSTEACFLADEKEINKLIDKMQQYIDQDQPTLTQDQKLMIMLGFVPRGNDWSNHNNYCGQAFLYHYIKRIKPNLKPIVMEDGTLFANVIKNNQNKTAIILQAHSDVVNFNQELDGKYGPYGPTGDFYLAKNNKEIILSHHNEQSSLGADDGKGLVTILSFLQNCNTKQIDSNIKILITAYEELGVISIAKIQNLRPDIMQELFDKNMKQTIYLNLDSYSGYQIDTYLQEGNNKNKNLTQKIIDKHEKFLADSGMISMQNTAWNIPPSEAARLMWYLDSDEQMKQNTKDKVLFVSLAANSNNPHSCKETIDLVELQKFNDWFNNDFILWLSKQYKKEKIK